MAYVRANREDEERVLQALTQKDKTGSFQTGQGTMYCREEETNTYRI